MNSIKIEKPDFGKPNWNVKGPYVGCFADIDDTFSVYTFPEHDDFQILAQNEEDAEIYLLQEITRFEQETLRAERRKCPGCGDEIKCDPCEGCDEYECQCSCEDDED